MTIYLGKRAEPVFTARGPNMNNDSQHCLNVRMYRHLAIKTENTILIDDIQVEAVTEN